MLSQKDIQELDDKGLMSRVENLRSERFKLRMQKKTMDLEKTHELKIMRKDIARLLTEKSARAKGRK